MIGKDLIAIDGHALMNLSGEYVADEVLRLSNWVRYRFEHLRR